MLHLLRDGLWKVGFSSVRISRTKNRSERREVLEG